LNYKRICFYWN